MKVSEQDLDDHESIEVLKIPVKDAVQMVMDGKIKANSSAHAILKVWCDRGTGTLSHKNVIIDDAINVVIDGFIYSWFYILTRN